MPSGGDNEIGLWHDKRGVGAVRVCNGRGGMPARKEVSGAITRVNAHDRAVCVVAAAVYSGKTACNRERENRVGRRDDAKSEGESDEGGKQPGYGVFYFAHNVLPKVDLFRLMF